MKESLYVAAIEEAHRFLKAAATLEAECGLRGETGPRGIPGYYPPSKQTGALKRASMDLSRALSELRANGTRK